MQRGAAVAVFACGVGTRVQESLNIREISKNCVRQKQLIERRAISRSRVSRSAAVSLNFYLCHGNAVAFHKICSNPAGATYSATQMSLLGLSVKLRGGASCPAQHLNDRGVTPLAREALRRSTHADLSR